MNHTPHTVIVKKDRYSNSTTFDVSESKPAIFESLTVNIILEPEDEGETVIDTSLSEWVTFLVSFIWLIALIFFVVGLIVNTKKRRK